VGEIVTATGEKEAQEKARGRSTGFRGDIQGLRAIAVLAVLLYHSGVPFVRGGYVGVDVFFVVSGFLITAHLASELTSKTRIGFAEFYARRARRILPASFAVIVLTVVAAVIFQPPLMLASTLRDGAATALYVPNVLFAVTGTDYLAETAPSAFQQYWSLGIEEQFYLIWPIVMLLAFKFLGRSRRGLIAALMSVTVISLALSIYLTPKYESLAFFLLPTRAWELGIGGVLAVIVGSSPKWLNKRFVGLLGWPGLALVAYSIFFFTGQTPFPGWHAMLPVLGTAIVILAGTGNSSLSPSRLLAVRPAVFIGTISYSLYLIHWPLLVIPQDAVGLNHPLSHWVTIFLGLAAIPIGWLLFKYVEQPCRRSPMLTGHRARRSLIVALVGSVIIAGGAGIGIPIIQARSLNSGVAVAVTPLGPNPVGLNFVPSNVEPALWDVKYSSPVIYTNGCHLSESQVKPKLCEVGDNARAPKVALFGDSHAAQWYPALEALAKAGDIRLLSMTKSSCGSAALAGAPKCMQWRDNAIAMLAADPPDIILLGNYTYNKPNWGTALATTIAKLPEQSKIEILADTPRFPETPAICLSAHLKSASDCNAPRNQSLNEANRSAERSLGVGVIDLTDWMCNRESCPAVVGNYVVLRDQHHMTVPFSRALAPALRAQLLK
jgi:peptidoglycan/LPS O-acetylase OafA/YrhL